ncbi:hypothetical protein EBU02_12250 [bacterium]|nr:hypothetical protein [bacterium]
MSQSLSMSVANLGLMRAFDEIAKAAGVTYKEVVRSEAAKILEAASKNTTAAQVKLIKMSWKMPDAVWLLVQKQIAASIKRRKAARGLAKKSWKQVAEDMGLTIAVPSYVEAATTKNGDYPGDGKATEESKGSDFAIVLRNSRTYSPSIFDAIRRAMNGREKFFRENLKQGVFKSIETIAAKYPGLYTK